MEQDKTTIFWVTAKHLISSITGKDNFHFSCCCLAQQIMWQARGIAERLIKLFDTLNQDLWICRGTRDRNLMMISMILFGNKPCKGSLVIFSFIEHYVKGEQILCMVTSQHGNCQRRVNASGKECTERHIRKQMTTECVRKSRFQPFKPLFLRGLIIGFGRPLPVNTLPHFTIRTYLDPTARRKKLDVFPASTRSNGVPKCQVIMDTDRIKPPLCEIC